MKEKIKVYLADDHQMLIEGMKAVIKTNADFEVVGFCAHNFLVAAVVDVGAGDSASRLKNWRTHGLGE